MLSSSNARLAAARRLTGRSARRETGRFLVEGVQAVREALGAGVVVELFATEDAVERHPELTTGAGIISGRDAAGLSETVTPQGLIAVCRHIDVGLTEALERAPRLIAVLVEPNDPGNLGTIVRTADAAGAGAVIVVGGVDVYNGKALRAGAGSHFHLDLVLAREVEPVLAALTRAGLATLATTGRGSADLDELVADGSLSRPTAWLFGTEARGLPEAVVAGAHRSVRVPMYGAAESLNLGVAAAICLYASARAQHGRAAGIG